MQELFSKIMVEQSIIKRLFEGFSLVLHVPVWYNPIMMIIDYNHIPNIKAIYKITNPEGKIYIGSTKNLKVRISCHRYNSYNKGAKKLKESFLKYGVINHKLEILETNYNDRLRYDLEAKYINKFNSLEEGLNLVIPTSSWNKGIPMRKETKKKLEHTFFKKGQVSFNKGKSPSKETRAIWSKQRKGRIPYNKGKLVAIIPKMALNENGILEIVVPRRFKPELCKSDWHTQCNRLAMQYKNNKIPVSDDLKELARHSLRSRAFSEQHKANLSKAHKGRLQQCKQIDLPKFAIDENGVSKAVKPHRFKFIRSDWHKQCNRLSNQIRNLKRKNLNK